MSVRVCARVSFVNTREPCAFEWVCVCVCERLRMGRVLVVLLCIHTRNIAGVLHFKKTVADVDDRERHVIMAQ